MIFLDKSSTKPINKKWNKLLYLENNRYFQNLSSIDLKSVQNQILFNESKEKFKIWLSSPTYKIIFTSGATESVNLALKGIVFKELLLNGKEKKRTVNIVLSKVEHKASIEIAKYLEKLGIEIRYIPVLKTGVVDVKKVDKLIDKNTLLVSLPWANNETGNYQPLGRITEIKKRFSFLFHCDITTAVNYGPVDLPKFSIDLASFSAHKMCGIKGLGCLAIKNIRYIIPIIHGGGQQFGLRGGTENFPAIKVWSSFINNKLKTFKRDQEKVKLLENYFITKLKESFEDKIIFNSLINEKDKIPGIINISLPGVSNVKAVEYLSKKNIFIGTGSACNHLHFEYSEILHAMGFSKEEMSNVLRISFDETNSRRDFDELIKHIKLFLNKTNQDNIEENSEVISPDCESYRKLAFKSLFDRLRSNKNE